MRALSVYLALIGGTLTNVTTVALTDAQWSVAPAFLSNLSGPNLVGSLNSTLQRFSALVTTNNASISSVQPLLVFNWSSGVAVDFTVRCGVPQEELGAFATSVIPTTSAAGTRGIETDPLTGLIQAASWTIQANGTIPAGVTTSAKLFSWSDGTASNRVEVVYNGTTIQVLVIAATVTVYSQTLTAPAAGAQARVAISYNGTAYSAALNGAAFTGTTAAAVTGLNRLDTGMAQGGGSGFWNAPIQREVIWPTALSVTGITQ